MNDYAKDVLVSTEWVAQHLNDENVRLIEVDEDILLYDMGHIPGAVKLDWQRDLWHDVERDFITADQVSELLGRLGLREGDTAVLYGDKSNWWAAYAYWFLTYSGVQGLKLMNGGRQKWAAEGRELTEDVPHPAPTDYPALSRDESLRAYRDEVRAHLEAVRDGQGALVDVRSPDEFSGKVTHMPNYPQEGVLRGGHIPGARNVPWAKATNEDGTFKSADELRALYEGEGVTADKDVIAYCRIAERSSHSWFVLRELLGYPKVRNYDGSWTEWGNAVGMPIEKSYREE
ncbi:Thiosulfate sulfurtransferase [Deinococcus proteolyticus MRP]|uniref:Sulfurtransferase n=1 Tax=Deinococcus proteolyticus (strain ATCC 35074 / DSM 20540 / JCM 6276 / NBRC 101906 / NCIMB 13154 / VKM Ac-1939 / CCM 2703 / MRP) TaxID=693977 RepID=F0RIU3_DEIPM|nr:sulfurtransferase [Deinococcus proteolyticus]ADY25202.1 Thiosulfate sulfurtransferase [Deinococcus proteolyticus MRP]